MNKILIVDDDDSILLLYTTTLEKEGYTVVPATLGEQALKILDADDIPVIVVDIMMPDMDGLTLMRKIKERRPDSIVIFVTAYAQLDSVLFALKEGAFAYLKKPFNPSELTDIAQKAFEKYNFSLENKKLVHDLDAAKRYNDNILRNMVFMLIATDLDGKINKVNQATEKLLGYTEEEIMGKSIETILAKDFVKSTWLNLLNEKRVKDFPVTLLRKDGATVALSFNGSVMKDEKGNIIGILGTANFNSL